LIESRDTWTIIKHRSGENRNQKAGSREHETKKREKIDKRDWRAER
jgi:hypothetical protein